MICDDVIELVREDPKAHGVFEAHTEETVTCFCKVNSVSRNEYYRARDNGLEPVFVFVLSEYADYHGEKVVIFKGRRYEVIRSYVQNHAVELTVGLATADAVKPDRSETTSETASEAPSETPAETSQSDS